MIGDVLLSIGALMVLIINITTMLLIFPCRRGLPFTLSVLGLFTLVFYAILATNHIVAPNYGGLLGLIFLPLIIWLFKGPIFQKVFAFFLQFLFTRFQTDLAITIGDMFLSRSEKLSLIITFTLMYTMLAVYLLAVFKYGRSFAAKLFECGQTKDWAFYSFGAIFSFSMISVSQLAHGSALQLILVLLFAIWSFAVLCFAIINTNAKSQQHFEAEFAREIISMGSNYYQRLNSLYDNLRILRHDYKYHLDIVSELLKSGDDSDAEKYLQTVRHQLPEKDLTGYCTNPILNALLTTYAERFAELSIHFDAAVSMPETVSIPNYELCIVLGNLLENALESCDKQEGLRKVTLKINTQGTYLAVMVGNTQYSPPQSLKRTGGLGIKSVQTVAQRHGGELMTEYDNELFTSYVLLKV